jgi:hypothetical protein
MYSTSYAASEYTHAHAFTMLQLFMNTTHLLCGRRVLDHFSLAHGHRSLETNTPKLGTKMLFILMVENYDPIAALWVKCA